MLISFLNGPRLTSFLFIFVRYTVYLYVRKNILLMTVFELQTSCLKATALPTEPQSLSNCLFLLMCCHHSCLVYCLFSIFSNNNCTILRQRNVKNDHPNSNSELRAYVQRTACKHWKSVVVVGYYRTVTTSVHFIVVCVMLGRSTLQHYFNWYLIYL